MRRTMIEGCCGFDRRAFLLAGSASLLGLSLLDILRLEAVAKASDSAGAKLTADDLGRRLAALYKRVSPAIVRLEGKDGPSDWGATGVIVSADGLVLTSAVAVKGEPVVVHLPGGRRVKGVTWGWSGEWNIGLVKIQESGPWPHVNVGEGGKVRAGAWAVSFGYLAAQTGWIDRQPSVRLESVTLADPGRWFLTTGGRPASWWDADVVFDLDGRIMGAGRTHWPDPGPVYADAKQVMKLWDELAGGEHLDRERLFPAEWRKDTGPGDQDLRKVPTIPKAVQEKATAATVRIHGVKENVIKKDSGDWSGTIVSRDGIIVTCAHMFRIPGEAVTVSLPDGRTPAGEVVSINPISDVGLVRITESGPWLHVERGQSSRLRTGNPCLIIGYPGHRSDKQPLVLTSTVVKSGTDSRLNLLHTSAKTAQVFGGMSGCGVFDADGRLVAVHQGEDFNDGNTANRHGRVELVHEIWEDLAVRRVLGRATASPLAAIEVEFRPAADGARRWVVEVLDDKKTVALGTIVSQDGRILTKASALPEAPACRLPNGRILPAKVVKTSREHDLAVLKVAAADLAPADWSPGDAPAAGLFVEVVVPGPLSVTGIVTHPARPIPPERGDLGVSVGDDGGVLKVADVRPSPPFPKSPLRKGDVIVAIDGRPTPDLKALGKLLEPSQGDRIAIAGDPVQVRVIRKDKAIEFRIPLGPSFWPRPESQSPRCTGLSRAFDIEADLLANLFGGPVVDREGRVVGVAIACRARGWLIVVPAAAAKSVMGE